MNVVFLLKFIWCDLVFSDGCRISINTHATTEKTETWLQTQTGTKHTIHHTHGHLPVIIDISGITCGNKYKCVRNTPKQSDRSYRCESWSDVWITVSNIHVVSGVHGVCGVYCNVSLILRQLTVNTHRSEIRRLWQNNNESVQNTISHSPGFVFLSGAVEHHIAEGDWPIPAVQEHVIDR